MQPANDLTTLRLAGGQREGTPAAPAGAARTGALPAFLAGLPDLHLSDTGRRNVCGRFGLTNDELTAALAECAPAPHPAAPVGEIGAEALACALGATGKAYPTTAQLDAALAEMYPHGGPTAADLLAAGLLVPTIDKTALRLPPPPAVALGRPFPSPVAPQRSGNR